MSDPCSRIREHLPLYAEGELRDLELGHRIRVHVLCCPDCQDWIDDYERLTAGILELSAPLGAEDEPDVADGVMRRVERLALARRWRPRWARLGAAAAVVAAALAGFWGAGVWRGRAAPERGAESLLASMSGARRADAADLGGEGAHGIRWIVDRAGVGDRAGDLDLDAGTREAREEVRLLGMAARPRRERAASPADAADESEPVWVFHGRLDELFSDPLSGGWTYLLEEAPDGSAAAPAPGPRIGARAIPVRRLDLSRLPSADRSRLRPRRGAPGAPEAFFRLVVVPDPVARAEALPLSPALYHGAFRRVLVEFSPQRAERPEPALGERLHAPPLSGSAGVFGREEPYPKR